MVNICPDHKRLENLLQKKITWAISARSFHLKGKKSDGSNIDFFKPSDFFDLLYFRDMRT